MSLGDPANKIPGLIAGGSGKAASDAGDDVRNADGEFIATNLGLDTLQIVQCSRSTFSTVLIFFLALPVAPPWQSPLQ